MCIATIAASGYANTVVEAGCLPPVVAILRASSQQAQSSACANTCFEASCDYWDGGVWGTCAVLESSYHCDCGGCECDGCPQGTCGVDAPFDPTVCLNAGDARCDAAAYSQSCEQHWPKACQRKSRNGHGGHARVVPAVLWQPSCGHVCISMPFCRAVAIMV